MKKKLCQLVLTMLMLLGLLCGFNDVMYSKGNKQKLSKLDRMFEDILKQYSSDEAEKAKVHSEKFIDSEPQDYRGYYLLSLFYKSADDKEQEELNLDKAFEKAIRTDKKDMDILHSIDDRLNELTPIRKEVVATQTVYAETLLKLAKKAVKSKKFGFAESVIEDLKILLPFDESLLVFQHDIRLKKDLSHYRTKPLLKSKRLSKKWKPYEGEWKMDGVELTASFGKNDEQLSIYYDTALPTPMVFFASVWLPKKWDHKHYPEIELSNFSKSNLGILLEMTPNNFKLYEVHRPDDDDDIAGRRPDPVSKKDDDAPPPDELPPPSDDAPEPKPEQPKDKPGRGNGKPGAGGGRGRGGKGAGGRPGPRPRKFFMQAGGNPDVTEMDRAKLDHSITAGQWIDVKIVLTKNGVVSVFVNQEELLVAEFDRIYPKYMINMSAHGKEEYRFKDIYVGK